MNFLSFLKFLDRHELPECCVVHVLGIKGWALVVIAGRVAR